MILSFIKYKTLTVLSLLMFFYCSTFAQWKWLHPAPQGNDLTVISFANNSTGWAAGKGGAILKTTDAGENWTSQNIGYFDKVAGLYFPNVNSGYAAMETNFFHSTNGGNTWSIAYRFSDLNCENMFFLNADTGYIAGVFNGFYSLKQTYDAGVTWQTAVSNLTEPINAIYVNSNGNGYAVGGNGLYISTSNYGTVWNTSSPVASTTINAINFADNLNGYMAGDAGKIYKTTDGGLNWNPSINPSGTVNLNSIYFYNSNNGVAGGENSTLLYTNNGGAAWQSVNQPSWFNIYAAYAFNATDFIMTGSNGEIIKSTNSGLSWNSKQIRVADKNLSGVTSAGSSTLFTAGDHGTILKTVNAGSAWTSLNSGTSTSLNDIAALSANNITAIGDSGTIFNSTNGGTSWTGIASPLTDDFYSICKASATRLFICGNAEAVLRSDNSGATWQIQNTPLSGVGYKFNEIFFVSADTGWIATDGFEILRTVNGGLTWIITSTTFSPGISSVYFINHLHGWACTINGDVLESTDGGITYQLLYSKQVTPFEKIIFTDAQNGWVFGNGKVYRTADGGLTFSDEYMPSQKLIHDAVFLNGNEAIAVGDGLSSILGRSGDLIINISDSILCSNHSYITAVNSTGTFNPGNVFTVQLSDEFGNFDYPLTVGSVTGTVNTPILITIPDGLTDASTYHIRVISSNPPINSPVNNNALTIHTSPNAYAYTLTSTAICQGDSVTILAIYSSAWSYQWYKNSLPISGATSDSIVVDQTGDYTVNASDGICDYTSPIVDVLVLTCTGINEHDAASDYSAYPNPTSKNLKLEWKNNVSVDHLILTDVTGRNVKIYNEIGNRQQTIDVSDLQSGVYFISIYGNKPFTLKIVVE